ncbi:DUF3298 domain-containing protein [Salinimicrobium catena]|uniref:DUF3298 and DUF4163 domain-containing protein n=1 Tax=Salinimicrobium catena TaxID=390640 RepID=UPI002FE45014
MTLRILQILLIVLLFSACQDEKKSTEIPLRFEKQTFVKKAGENCDTAEYDCSIISLEVLKAKGPQGVSEKINNALEDHVISTISSEEEPKISTLEELTESFISDYKKALQSFSSEPPWEAYLNQSIYRQDEQLLCIGVTTEIFSGGAHGYKNLSFLNFDPQTGEQLSWKDIFTPEFKKYTEQRFRKEHEIPAEDNINSTGFWFENEAFHLPANIGFTDEEVILIYNSYEIAPYADGDFYMEIPMEEVRPFLKNQ